MLKRKDMLPQVEFYLSHLATYVAMQNKNGDYDINKYCEDFFEDLLNLVYGLNLKNLNKLKMNFPAIDLADDDAEICFQVTADNSSTKIKDTLDKFKKEKLYEDYQEIFIFIVGAKKSYTSDFEYKEFDFDKAENIIDINDLSKVIRDIKDKEKMESILSFLKKNVRSVDSDTTSSLLDSIEEVELKEGKNYKTFICDYSDFKMNSDEAKSTINGLKNFGKQLMKLNRSTREVVYAIAQGDIKFIKFFDGVPFNKKELTGYLHKSKETVYDELKILMQKGHLTITEENDGEYDMLLFWDENKDWEVLRDVIKYCKKYSKDIKKVILELDFTIFD